MKKKKGATEKGGERKNRVNPECSRGGRREQPMIFQKKKKKKKPGSYPEGQRQAMSTLKQGKKSREFVHGPRKKKKGPLPLTWAEWGRKNGKKEGPPFFILAQTSEKQGGKRPWLSTP